MRVACRWHHHGKGPGPAAMRRNCLSVSQGTPRISAIRRRSGAWTPASEGAATSPSQAVVPDAPAAGAKRPALAAPLFPPVPVMVDNHARREGGTMPLLDDAAVEKGLKRLPGWERRGNEIVKTFARRDFMGAISFVHEVADAAEAT